MLLRIGAIKIIVAKSGFQYTKFNKKLDFYLSDFWMDVPFGEDDENLKTEDIVEEERENPDEVMTKEQ